MKRIYVVKSILVLSAVLFCNEAYTKTDAPLTISQNNNFHSDEVHTTSSKYLSQSRIRELEDSVYTSLYKPVYERGISLDSIDLQVVQSSPDANKITLRHIVPTTNNLDNYGIGQIEINSGSNKNGSKFYTIPIKCASGINGLNPNISINYDSQSGNGILGCGWNIDGLHIILRVSKSIYHDSVASAVEGNNEDAFSLDGTRLIRIDKKYNHIDYETEQGCIRARAFIENDSISSFLVFYPNGNRAKFIPLSNEYGNLIYVISELYDLQNNKIAYDYHDSPHEIASIRYNESSILFEYQNRPDTISSYAGGYFIGETKRLENIKCYNGSYLMNEYRFSYDIYNNISLLKEIGAKVAGVDLSPIKFSYGENAAASAFTKSKTQLLKWYESEDSNMVRILNGKFDYENGVDGLITYPIKDPYWLSDEGGWHFVNNYDGDEKIFLYGGLTDSYADPLPDITTGEGFVDILCADIFGNQKDCVIKINNRVINGKEQLDFHVYGKESIGGVGKLFTRTFTLSTAMYTNNHWNIVPKYYYAGDFDGDGRMEIMAVSEQNPLDRVDRMSRVYIFDIENEKLLFGDYIFGHNVEFFSRLTTNAEAARYHSDRIIIMDCNGDGKSDICHIDNNGTKLFSFNIVDGIWKVRGINTDLNWTLKSLNGYDVVPGDFNGDSMTDLAQFGDGVHRRTGGYVYYSKGNGNFINNHITLYAIYPGEFGKYLTHDINGDGRSDLIHYFSNGFNTFLSRPLFDKEDAFKTEYEENASFAGVSVNSHNQTIKLSSIKNGIVTKYEFSRKDDCEVLLTGMVNSLGILEKNKYAHINHQGENANGTKTFYTMGDDAVYPYVNLQEAIPVLERTSTYMSGNLLKEEIFSYKNAVFHKQGRGFCGFEQIVSDDNNQMSHVKIYEPYKFGTLKKEETNRYVTEYINSLSINNQKISKVLVDSINKYDKSTGMTSTTSYEYDDFGFVVSEKTSYPNTPNTISVEKYYTYESNSDIESGYSLGYPLSCIVSQKRGASIFVEKTEIVSHNQRKPYCVKKYINGNESIMKEFTYDSVGNRVSESSRLFSSPDVTHTLLEYDSKGRKVKEINSTGHTLRWSYDDFGRVSMQTDKRGNTTYYRYSTESPDKTIEYPDGSKKTEEYYWIFDDTNSRYGKKIKHEGKPTETIIYDALGQEIRHGTTGLEGNVIYTEKTYDTRGNVVKMSLPHFDGDEILWKIMEYDDFDRLLSVSEPSGRNSSYSYSGSYITSVIDKVTVTKEYDVFGNLLSVTDAGGMISYELGADGKPETMTAPGNIKTEFTYDKFRRRIDLNDPSHGNVKWTYDNNGHIASMTNANGETQNREYDKFGNLLKLSTPEFQVNYSYNEYYDPVGVSSNNGTSKIMDYDNFGRMTLCSETGPDNESLTKRFTYQYNELKSITYRFADNYSVKETYVWKNGHLNEVILNDNKTLFKIQKENNFGQPVHVISGPLVRTYKYDKFGFPSNRKVLCDTIVIQNIDYSYDYETQNLITKKDLWETHNYSYDELNRVSSLYDGISFSSESLDADFLNSDSDETHNNPYAPKTASCYSDIPEQTIIYNSVSRPKIIEQGKFKALFDYNAEYERVKMTLFQDSTEVLRRYYLGGCLEKDERITFDRYKLYMCNDYYKAPAFISKSGSLVNLFYILRDNLGSITHVVNENGNKIYQMDYNEWGTLEKREESGDKNIMATSLDPYHPDPIMLTNRGFTGHEHIPEFNLINMNARLYDPYSKRFLSPDPYLQNPESTTGLDRYLYATGNPLKYTDPNGEFFIGTILTVLGETFANLFTHGFAFKHYDYSRTKIAWKIDTGMFKGNFGQIINKWTYGGLNSAVGNLISHGVNWAGMVDGVTEMDGMLALSGITEGSAAFTVGHYSLGPDNYTATYKDHLFVHEYGHYIQSQRMGPAYFSVVAIPSLLSAWFTSDLVGMKHDYRWFEINASKLAARYFNREYGPNSSHTGEEGFVPFNVSAFSNGGNPGYINPRDNNSYQFSTPTHGSRVVAWDFSSLILFIL